MLILVWWCFSRLQSLIYLLLFHLSSRLVWLANGVIHRIFLRARHLSPAALPMDPRSRRFLDFLDRALLLQVALALHYKQVVIPTTKREPVFFARGLQVGATKRLPHFRRAYLSRQLYFNPAILAVTCHLLLEAPVVWVWPHR
jgi:hypothetical protein